MTLNTHTVDLDLLDDDILNLEPLQRVSRDLKNSAQQLTEQQARYLVDLYYQIQEFRKGATNEKRASVQAAEPNEMVDWTAATMFRIERTIHGALDSYTDKHPLGIWCKSICGIGPVISAGLLAHIDIKKAPTVGHIWSFAGLNPTAVWGKGQKRPWNARLKVLCWKIGESFVKVQNNPKDIYGQIYTARKAIEQKNNEEDLYKEQAERILGTKRIGHDTDAYKAYITGKLPPAHIHARAKRYAVKLFLAHYHAVGYWITYQQLAPKPYVLEHLGHVHFITPPNLAEVPGLEAAYAAIS